MICVIGEFKKLIESKFEACKYIKAAHQKQKVGNCLHYPIGDFAENVFTKPSN